MFTSHFFPPFSEAKIAEINCVAILDSAHYYAMHGKAFDPFESDYDVNSWYEGWSDILFPYRNRSVGGRTVVDYAYEIYRDVMIAHSQRLAQ